jgi:hypothetical protein
LFSLYLETRNRLNEIYFNINILIEGVFLFIFFYLIQQHARIKKIILVAMSLFITYWVFRFTKALPRTPLFSCIIFEDFFILILAIYYFYFNIVKINSIFVYRQPIFWVVSAYLIYVAGTFFLALYYPHLSLNERYLYNLLNSMFIIVRTILLSIAMFMKTYNPRRQKFKLT